jgi:elongation factor 3
MDWIASLDASQPWKTRVAICNDISLNATEKDVMELVPILKSMLHDAKLAVKESALEALKSICSKIKNKDIDALMPQLLEAMMNPDKVNDTIHALSATTFVQSISESVLSILVPLLERALTKRGERAIQRKACVIIENMAKLVDQSKDICVFFPVLVPLVKDVCEHASDPDNRATAIRTLQTLERVLKSALKLGHSYDTGDIEEEGMDLCNCDFSLAYGAKILLKNAKLHLKRGYRYGLCGANGIGKSTLLRAISNEQVDGFPPKDILKTVYVEHDIDANESDMTIFDYIYQDGKSGFHEDEVRSELLDKGFGKHMQTASIQSLSGGWKMKLALVKAMLLKPDILLLDEPTNHLDIHHVAWLENYLTRLTHVSCIIVSHDSSFLDNVCSHIIHYIDFKLHTYKGNLSHFVKLHPEAQSYYDLQASVSKFKFPEPGFLEGVKTKDKAVIKAQGISFKYPNTDRMIFNNATLFCNLSSRIAIMGPNGAGKSTLVKMLMGELEPTQGTIWRHPNLRIAYVAQHAFHHIEQHLDKTPMQYMQWRYATGEDREKEDLAMHQLTAEEQKKIESKFVFDGLKRTIETLVSRRKSKKSYEYEVKWQDYGDHQNTWFEREDLEHMGFSKWIQELDQKEATRLGMMTRPLTSANICLHFQDVGLDKEIVMHSRMTGLSGGQKVKVVLASAMWLNPHLLFLDEPTNYLDRDSLGALAHAIQTYGGGVIIITHHHEFSGALCKETWSVQDGVFTVSGAQSFSDVKEKITMGPAETEMVDALGNVIQIKQKKTNLSNKEKKKLQKMKEARRARGEIVSSDEEDFE